MARILVAARPQIWAAHQMITAVVKGCAANGPFNRLLDRIRDVSLSHSISDQPAQPPPRILWRF